MDILAALPKTPGMAPEALWAWLKRNGKVHPQELIRYKTTRLADPLTGIREKYAACNCTACGESWHTTIALPGEGGAYPYFDTEEGPRRNGAPREYADTLGGEGVAFADKYKNLWTVQRFGLVRVWNYIRKQQESARKIHSIGGTVGFCVDYWKDAERAGLDLKSEVVAFPHSVTEAQARATAAIRYREDAALRGKFEKMAKRLQALRWEYMGLIITPAESEEQLILEGKALGHCVGGYGKAHCSGESIFFIRHTESPKESYFTLQLDTATGKVLQNRGRHNCARTQEVEAFEQAWLCQVVKPWLDHKQKTVNPNHAKTAAA